MSIFSDALGQEWTIEFDGATLDRVFAEAKIDLADMSANGLLAIERDAKALVRVLTAACADQLRQRRKPAAEFQKQIRKDAITRGRAAVLDALADFFPESEWSAMQSNLTKLRNQPTMTPEQLTLAVGFLKMDPDTQREVLSLIQEEAGNSPKSLDDEFASGPAATPPSPVENLPASAMSAPAA